MLLYSDIICLLRGSSLQLQKNAQRISYMWCNMFVTQFLIVCHWHYKATAKTHLGL